ncbi:MAG: metalloregulator ArsR/SmtB family transcription factor [Bacteroidia bacterium]|jgi:ArsR family transcriptional regulator|nr:metalloregulator ArsR/SmtB family transcription factor [Bacteroidia bacterium]
MNTVQQADWTLTEMELMSRTLKAIAHPARLAIIEMLHGGRRLTVTEIYTRLHADQSAVSHHLSIMRDNRVLDTERRGKYIYYYLRQPAFISLMNCLGQLN